MLALIGVFLVLLVLFASVIGGFLGVAIVTLSLATASLLVALRSFLRPGAFQAALQHPAAFADPRAVFAQAARIAATGEVLVSYTRYQRVYRVTVLTVGVLLILLGIAVVVALLRAGTSMGPPPG